MTPARNPNGRAAQKPHDHIKERELARIPDTPERSDKYLRGAASVAINVEHGALGSIQPRERFVLGDRR